MQQPDFLKTDDRVPWCWGHGHDVWGMLDGAVKGDIAALSKLLNNDPELVRCQCQYRPPIHFAVLENQIEAVKLLLDRGGDLTYTLGRSWDECPAQLARDRGYQQLLQLVNEHQHSHWGICPAGDEIASAFRVRDEQLTRHLLDQHGTESADVRGNKPIHWAVMTRQVELIDSLIQQGADINARRPDGARPIDLTNGDYWYRGWRDLHPDAPQDHWAVLDHLLLRGADYDLTTACRRNDVDRVREILAKDAAAARRDADYSTWYSGYPLRSASQAGNIEIVNLLLEFGADPNRPEHGLAPFGGSLYDAAQNGHYDILQLLLENGGDPNQDVESSGCVLSAATDDRTRQLLRDHGAIYDVYGCCYYGYSDDFAIQCQRNPHVANDSSMFAMAAENGFREIVDHFLKYQRDLWSRMPACLGKTAESTRWMVENGMDVNRCDWLGIHPLHRGCSAESLRTWIELGVNANLVDGEHKSTPLGWAARCGKLDYARTLLENGADPNAAGAVWAKPLAWAQRRGHAEIEALLRKYGAD